MFVNSIVVSYDDNELAEQAFKNVIAKVWMEGRLADVEDQEMGGFFTTILQAIQDVDWLEGQGMQFIRFGDKYIFFHYNGSSIQYNGGELSIKFAHEMPYLDQKTLEVLNRV